MGLGTVAKGACVILSLGAAVAAASGYPDRTPRNDAPEPLIEPSADEDLRPPTAQPIQFEPPNYWDDGDAAPAPGAEK